MHIVVIGGVAAGTKAAAKLLRQDRSARVSIYTKSKDISYAGCGLPYYVGGSIESRNALIVHTPARYAALTGVEVHTEMEAVAVDAAAKTVTFAGGEVVSYDQLIIATGAGPFVPDVAGVDLAGVFTIRTLDDAIGLREYLQAQDCRSAVVVGGGFIGLEMAENLLARGLQVTVVDLAAQVMPGLFDEEMADYIRRRLQKAGIRVVTGAGLTAILGENKAGGIATSVGNFAGDVVVLAIGIRPATAWLSGSGIEMDRGTIVVDSYHRTSCADIYAVGDCARVFNRLTGRGQWSAMGSTANITGRLLAKNMTGENMPYGGCLGTGVVKLCEGLNAGRTGLTEAQAREAGFDVITATCVTDDKAHYFPGAGMFVTKLVADRESRKLLGIQVVGSGAVDKMVDIAVMGISMGAKIADFDTLDFAYAPPFSTAIHPFVQACYILENKLSGAYVSMTPAEYAATAARGFKIIDVNPKPSIPGAQWIDLSRVDGPVEGLEKDEKLLLVCTRGKRAYFLQNRLRAFGYTAAVALEGGLTVNEVKVSFEGPAAAGGNQAGKGAGMPAG